METITSYLGDVLSVILLFLCLFAWIWAIADILNRRYNGSKALLWILIVFFFPFLGTILYILIGRRKTNQA